MAWFDFEPHVENLSGQGSPRLIMSESENFPRASISSLGKCERCGEKQTKTGPAKYTTVTKMYLSNSELRQLDLLKKKTPVERFLLMTQLIQGQVEAMKAEIRRQNPNLDEKGLKQCFKERMFKIYSTEQKGKYK